MTIDDAILRGAQFTRDHLELIEQVYGPAVATAYAASMATGARNVVAEKQGRRASFELMQGLADDLIEPEAGAA